MTGIIRTYQKCPKCGKKFSSSKGGFPIICQPCMTQPTKYFISYFWNKQREKAYYDRSGRTLNDWGHASATLGELRTRMADHKSGKGFFTPDDYKKQSSASFKASWDIFQKKYSGATKDKIDAIYRNHFVGLNDLNMRDILPWHIHNLWQDLQDKKLSPRYLNDILGWLKSFFVFGVKLDIVEERLLKKFPDFLTMPEPEVDEWFTEAEQLAVLDAIPEHDRPIFDFLFLTGCRVNEACALRRSDINVKNDVVIIQNTIKRDGSIGIVKNKKKRRIKYSAIKSCFPQTEVVSLTGFVFLNKWKRRYSDDYLRDTLNKACDKAEVKRIKLKNATRHSFGMGLLNKGYDIWQVSKIMNHSDLKITEHYAKMLDKEVQGAYGRSEPKVSQVQIIDDLSN